MLSLDPSDGDVDLSAAIDEIVFDTAETAILVKDEGKGTNSTIRHVHRANTTVRDTVRIAGDHIPMKDLGMKYDGRDYVWCAMIWGDASPQIMAQHALFLPVSEAKPRSVDRSLDLSHFVVLENEHVSWYADEP